MYLKDDYWFGGKDNLCNEKTIEQYCIRYMDSHPDCKAICNSDVRLFVRNKRYDIIFENIARNIDMDAFLDEKFGTKGVKGGNLIRSEARAFYTRHKPASMKRIYKENENIIILMDEVKKMEESINE